MVGSSVVLLIIGGLNLGLTGVFDYSILVGLFGRIPTLLRTIYVLIGLAALRLFFTAVKNNRLNGVFFLSIIAPGITASNAFRVKCVKIWRFANAQLIPAFITPI